LLREDREALILADQLGFREVYVGRHATASPESLVPCALFLATLAETTDWIRLDVKSIDLSSLPGNRGRADCDARILFDGRRSSESAPAAC